MITIVNGIHVAPAPTLPPRSSMRVAEGATCPTSVTCMSIMQVTKSYLGSTMRVTERDSEEDVHRRLACDVDALMEQAT